MDSSTSRRSFLKTAITLPAALAVGPSLLTASADPASASANQAESVPLPMRPLGRSGRKVTMVSLGGMMAAYSPDYLDIAWSMGIRYFDNADCYIGGQSEHRLGAWLAKYPERRKEVLHRLEGSSPPGSPAVAPDDRYPPQPPSAPITSTSSSSTASARASTAHQSLDWPKSDDFKRVVDQAQELRQGRRWSASPATTTGARRI